MQLPRPGQTFETKYEIRQELGEGGFATVFWARDTEVERDVAIKVLAPRDGGYPSKVVARFMREARVIANLQDPHTIKLYEFGESSEGLLYMVFQYVSGLDLREVVQRRGALPPEVVIHVMAQVLSALSEAHSAGILHRDIKPANILVHEYMGDEYSTKLLDFGIAKVEEPVGAAGLTKTGAMIGTPRYMAPEQIFGEKVGPYSDIYSLGLVAYEMLVGKPVASGSKEEMLRKQVSDEPIYLPYDVAWMSLRQVVERMLAKDPRQRFSSAIEARNAFKFALKNRQSLPSGPLPHQSSTSGKIAGMPQHSSGVQFPPANSSGGAVFQTPVDITPTGHSSGATTPTGYSSGATPVSRERPTFSSAQHAVGEGGYTSTELAGRPPSHLLLGGLALTVVIGSAAAYMFWKEEPKQTVVLPTRQQPIGSGIIELPADMSTTSNGTEPADVVLHTSDGGHDSGPDATQPGFDGCGIEHKWQYERWIDVNADRHRRAVQVFLPRSYDPDKRYPIVIALQLKNWDVKQFFTRSKLDDVVARGDAIVLGPEPTSRFDPWVDPSDIPVIRATVSRAVELFCVDRTRVFAFGSGAGGLMARELACRMPLSGVATTGDGEPSQADAQSCDPEPAVPMLWILGRQDKFVPHDGRRGCSGGNFLSFEQHHTLWKQRYQCDEDTEAKRWLDEGESRCFVWDCPLAPYAACDAAGGHYLKETSWTTLDPSGCDSPPLGLEAGPAAWTFFDNYGKPLNVDAP